MAGAQRSRGERPWCGLVQAEVADLRCEVAPERATEGALRVHGPVCSRLVLAPAPLSWDAVLDAHIALERGCGPQECGDGSWPGGQVVANDR